MHHPQQLPLRYRSAPAHASCFRPTAYTPAFYDFINPSTASPPARCRTCSLPVGQALPCPSHDIPCRDCHGDCAPQASAGVAFQSRFEPPLTFLFRFSSVSQSVPQRYQGSPSAYFHSPSELTAAIFRCILCDFCAVPQVPYQFFVFRAPDGAFQWQVPPQVCGWRRAV